MKDKLLTPDEISKLATTLNATKSDNLTLKDSEFTEVPRHFYFSKEIKNELSKVFKSACRRISFKITDSSESDFKINCATIDELTYEEAIRCIDPQSVCFVLKSSREEKLSVIAMDIKTAHDLVCHLQDKASCNNPQNQNLSPKELWLLNLYINTIIEELNKVLKKKYDIEFSVERIEFNTQRADIAEDEEHILLSSFNIDYKLKENQGYTLLNIIINLSHAYF